MRKQLMTLTLILVTVIGTWVVIHRDQIDNVNDALTLAQNQFQELAEQIQSASRPPRPDRLLEQHAQSIKIASFNITFLSQDETHDIATLERLAKIVGEFDVVAVQGIRTADQTALRRLVDLINTGGSDYDYVLSAEVGTSALRQQFAFIFDRRTLVLDVANRYSIADPDDLVQCDPFVGWFRAREPDPSLAFTFSLVNMRVDPDNSSQELAQLDSIFRAVRDDGRLEDDIILAGDFYDVESAFNGLDVHSPLHRAIVGRPTDIQVQNQFDNILFDPTATSEFTGRADVFDFLRAYNLSWDESLKISSHLPVWAEFQIHEGGSTTSVAQARKTAGISAPGESGASAQPRGMNSGETPPAAVESAGATPKSREQR